MKVARCTGTLCAVMLVLSCGGGAGSPDSSAAADAIQADVRADTGDGGFGPAPHGPDAAPAGAGPDSAPALDARREGAPGLMDLQGAWFEEFVPPADGGVPEHRRLRVEGSSYFEVMNGWGRYCGETGTLTASAATVSLAPLRTEGGCPPGETRTGTASWTDSGVAITFAGRVARYARAREVPKVFVTVETHDGNFAGDATLAGAHAIDKADAFCNRSIARPDGRSYKALLVDGTRRSAVPPQDWVLRPDTTYYQADGVRNVFRTSATGVSRSSGYNPLLSDQEASRYSWIGLAPGFKTRLNVCDGWSSNDPMETGALGDAAEPQFTFGFNVSSACDSRQTLVCVSQ